MADQVKKNFCIAKAKKKSNGVTMYSGFIFANGHPTTVTVQATKDGTGVIVELFYHDHWKGKPIS